MPTNQPLFEHPGSWKGTNPLPADYYYGPWADAAQACQKVLAGVRYDGLTVLLQGQGEYWWRADNLSDAGLARKYALPDERDAQLLPQGLRQDVWNKFAAAPFAASYVAVSDLSAPGSFIGADFSEAGFRFTCMALGAAGGVAYWMRQDGRQNDPRALIDLSVNGNSLVLLRADNSTQALALPTSSTGGGGGTTGDADDLTGFSYDQASGKIEIRTADSEVYTQYVLNIPYASLAPALRSLLDSLSQRLDGVEQRASGLEQQADNHNQRLVVLEDRPAPTAYNDEPIRARLGATTAQDPAAPLSRLPAAYNDDAVKARLTALEVIPVGSRLLTLPAPDGSGTPVRAGLDFALSPSGKQLLVAKSNFTSTAAPAAGTWWAAWLDTTAAANSLDPAQFTPEARYRLPSIARIQQLEATFYRYTDATDPLAPNQSTPFVISEGTNILSSSPGKVVQQKPYDHAATNNYGLTIGVNYDGQLFPLIMRGQTLTFSEAQAYNAYIYTQKSATDTTRGVIRAEKTSFIQTGTLFADINVVEGATLILRNVAVITSNPSWAYGGGTVILEGSSSVSAGQTTTTAGDGTRVILRRFQDIGATGTTGNSYTDAQAVAAVSAILGYQFGGVFSAGADDNEFINGYQKNFWYIDRTSGTIYLCLENTTRRAPGGEGTTAWRWLYRFPTSSNSGGSYTLPTATADRLGGIKAGKGLTVDENGVASTDTVRAFDVTDANNIVPVPVAGYTDGYDANQILGGNSSIVAGGLGNQISAASLFAAILGGYRNRFYGDGSYGVIAGGQLNQVRGKWAAVLGGQTNGAYAPHAALVGGQENAITANGARSFLAGGYSNIIRGADCVVLSSTSCTIPDGCSRVALLNCNNVTLSAAVSNVVCMNCTAALKDVVSGKVYVNDAEYKGGTSADNTTTSGTSGKLEVQIATKLSQQDAVPVGSDDYRIPFSQRVYGPDADADLATHEVVIPSAMRGIIMVSVVLKRVTIGGFYQIAITVNAGLSTQRNLSIGLSPTADAVGNGGNADLFLALYASTVKATLQAGDRISCRLYAGQGANLRGQYGGQECTLSFIQD